jgi:hypothetical protein
MYCSAAASASDGGAYVVEVAILKTLDPNLRTLGEDKGLFYEGKNRQ